MAKAIWELRGWLSTVAVVFAAGYFTGLGSDCLNWDAVSAVGAWAAGGGALAAAFVALHISDRERRHRLDEAAARRVVLEYQCAMLLEPTMADIANQARTLFNRLEEVATGILMHESQTQGLQLTGLEDIEAQLERMDSLDRDAGANVMSVVALGKRLNRAIDRSIRPALLGDNRMASVEPGILVDDVQHAIATIADAAASARDYMNGVIVKHGFVDLTTLPEQERPA